MNEPDANTTTKSRRQRKPKSKPDAAPSSREDASFDRDAEYRRLNAQLREKNYRLQQLEEKLGSGSVKQYHGEEKSGLAKEKRNANRNRKKNYREQQPSAVDAVNSAKTTPSMAPENRKSSSAPSPSSSRGMLRVALPTKAVPRAIDTSPPTAHAPDPLLVRHRQLESRLQSLLDQLKKDKSRLQDYCLLGIANGAPEIATAVSDLQRHYTDTIAATPLKACELEYPQLLWEMWHKLLQQFYAVLSSNVNKDAESALFHQVKAVFSVETKRCAEVMQSVLASLKALECNINDAVLLSSHTVYLALGNVARYQYIFPVDGHTETKEHAIIFYQKAIDTYPGQGAAHRCLAAIAKSDHDAYMTCYHLCRALSCTTALPAARESLLEILESQRELAESFPSFTALSGLSMQQHCERFRCHFLAASGIAFSRVSADHFPSQLDKCRRHFAMMLQLLSIECGDGSDRGSKGSAVMYAPDMHKQQRPADEALLAVVNKMESDFRYAITMCFSLLQQVVDKHGVKELVESSRYHDCYGGAEAGSYSIEEKIMLEKRYVMQRMHKIQTIPGFIDLARLMMSLICAAFTAEGVGVGTSGHTSAASQYRIQCTAASVCLFFEWLVSNSCFHVFPLLDIALWDQLESALPVYLAQLPKLPKKLTQKWDLNMTHDWDLRGFAPLQSIIESRANFEDSFSDSDLVAIYSERCRRAMRTLCHTPLVIGTSTHGICFDTHRQPCPVQTSTALLQVLNYRTVPASGGVVYATNQKILSRDEFLQGTVVPDEVQHEHMPDGEEQIDEMEDAAAVLAAQCAAMLSLPIDATVNTADSSTPPFPPPPPKEEGRGILRIAPTFDMHPKPVPASQQRGTRQARKGPPVKSNPSSPPPLIVIDAPNVAMRHGLNAKFSCKGIKLAIDFFKAAGHKVVAFLPDYYLDYTRVGDLRNATRLGITDERASKLPDNVTILQQLVSEGLLIGTPPQDYDDSYCITYAKHRGGYVITNDMYRDHVKRIENRAQRDELRQWYRSRSFLLISNFLG